MGLAAVLLLMLFIVGPTMYILNMFTNTLGTYISEFFDMSLRMAPLDEGNRQWINSWTIFYWAWWISWAPFVGISIARISKGRTVKELMLGVLFVPSLVCFIFFAVFGVSALNLEQNGIVQISQLSLGTSTFGVLAEYPLGTLMSIITICVVAIFFITSADSATFVLGMLTTNGMLNPRNSVKIIWGITQAAVAAIIVYFWRNTRSAEHADHRGTVVFHYHYPDGCFFLQKRLCRIWAREEKAIKKTGHSTAKPDRFLVLFLFLTEKAFDF